MTPTESAALEAMIKEMEGLVCVCRLLGIRHSHFEDCPHSYYPRLRSLLSSRGEAERRLPEGIRELVENAINHSEGYTESTLKLAYFIQDEFASPAPSLTQGEVGASQEETPGILESLSDGEVWGENHD